MGGETLKLVIGKWDATAESHLRNIRNDDCIRFYRDEVETGAATLLRAVQNDMHFATIIIRGEVNFADMGEDLVVVAAAADSAWSKEGSIFTRILPLIEAVARRGRYSHVRAHTPRRGLVRRMQNAGYEVYETVMRREVSHGAHV